MPETLSRAQARRLFVRAQGLDGVWPPLPYGIQPDSALTGPQAVARTVTRLGYVQLDTISVVERAHHHTLWRRQPDYAPEHLHRAQAVDRSIFEALFPNASYLPTEEYRYVLPSMRANAAWWADNWRASEREDRDRVLARIRDEGPLGTSDFEAPEGFVREGWWSWKPAKRTLEHLFITGELMVSERRGFERIMDLRERVLPPGIETSYPRDEELAIYLASQALIAMGVAGERNSRWRPGQYRTLLRQGLRHLEEADEAVQVAVEGVTKGDWYVQPADLSSADSAPDQGRAQILSPFDSLVTHREWLKALWDFDYTVECYVPRAKRKCGYFCLPVLWADRLVARVDAKADRKAGVLQAIRLILEPGVEAEDAFPPALAAALWELARFCGCNAVDVQTVEPERFRERLVAAVEDGGGQGQ
ncbi:MAG: winged helix-turn-helix domain-containing protein [Chloroflexi bacterium]|nr:winged helix-turn-helix domain-containing protein [Chloroflexota bacterium]